MTQIRARHRPRAITSIEKKERKLGKKRDHTTVLGTNVTGGG